MRGTLSGTPAARAGIRYGDVLLSVNGRRTRTVQDYVEAKALRGDGMALVVFRSGTEKVEELAYDEPSARMDPTAILAELVTLRIAPVAAGALGDAGDGGDGSDRGNGAPA